MANSQCSFLVSSIYKPIFMTDGTVVVLQFLRSAGRVPAEKIFFFRTSVTAPVPTNSQFNVYRISFVGCKAAWAWSWSLNLHLVSGLRINSAAPRFSLFDFRTWNRSNLHNFYILLYVDRRCWNEQREITPRLFCKMKHKPIQKHTVQVAVRSKKFLSPKVPQTFGLILKSECGSG